MTHPLNIHSNTHPNIPLSTHQTHPLIPPPHPLTRSQTHFLTLSNTNSNALYNILLPSAHILSPLHTYSFHHIFLFTLPPPFPFPPLPFSPLGNTTKNAVTYRDNTPRQFVALCTACSASRTGPLSFISTLGNPLSYILILLCTPLSYVPLYVPPSNLHSHIYHPLSFISTLGDPLCPHSHMYSYVYPF